jgi:hypothetical protein
MRLHFNYLQGNMPFNLGYCRGHLEKKAGVIASEKVRGDSSSITRLKKSNIVNVQV